MDDWKGWLDEIEKSDAFCLSYTTLIDKEEEQRAWRDQHSQAELQIALQKQIREALDTAQENQRARLDVEKCEKILHCLSSAYEEQKDINPKRVKGTCEWLLHHPKFLDWRNATDSRILLVTAGPGCGKSVLSRCLVDERRVATSLITSSVCYFFFKDGQEEQMTEANALRAIVHQLLRQHPQPSLIRHTFPGFKAHGENFRGLSGELWSCLMDILKNPATGEVVIILDALDECKGSERQHLLERLVNFFSNDEVRENPNIGLKLLITCRPYHAIETGLSWLSDSTSVVCLDGDEEHGKISQEINAVIEYRVPRVVPQLSKRAQDEIIQHLKSMDNRTYLWLYLILAEIEEQFITCGTAKGLRELISQLPKSVSDVYEGILTRSKAPLQARKALLIIIGAKKPLTVSEMNVALALTEQEKCPSYASLDLPSDDVFRSNLKHICGQLVSFYDHKVHLLHQSTREFLVHHPDSSPLGWQYSLGLNEAESILARICLSILNFSDFDESPLNTSFYRRSNDRYRQWLEDHSLLEYAGQHWADHYKLTPHHSTEDLLDIALRLCDASSGNFRAWYPLHRRTRTYRFSTYPSQRCGSCSLRVACFVGLEAIVRSLLDAEAQVYSRKEDASIFDTPGAISYDHEAMMELREEHSPGGVCSHELFEHHNTPLISACLSDHEAIVKLLLKHKADTQSSLQAAVYGRRERIVQLLIDHGVDVNEQMLGTDERTLMLASWAGSQDTVDLLLKNGANVHLVNGFHVNALVAAASFGDESIVRLLFDHGARFCKDDWANLDMREGRRQRLDKVYDETVGKDQKEVIQILMRSRHQLSFLPKDLWDFSLIDKAS